MTLAVRPSPVLAVIESTNEPLGRSRSVTLAAISARLTVIAVLPSMFTTALTNLTPGNLRMRIVSSCPLTHCVVCGSTNAEPAEIGFSLASKPVAPAAEAYALVAAIATRTATAVATAPRRSTIEAGQLRACSDATGGLTRRECCSSGDRRGRSLGVYACLGVGRIRVSPLRVGLPDKHPSSGRIRGPPKV